MEKKKKRTKQGKKNARNPRESGATKLLVSAPMLNQASCHTIGHRLLTLVDSGIRCRTAAFEPPLREQINENQTKQLGFGGCRRHFLNGTPHWACGTRLVDYDRQPR